MGFVFSFVHSAKRVCRRQATQEGGRRVGACLLPGRQRWRRPLENTGIAVIAQCLRRSRPQSSGSARARRICTDFHPLRPLRSVGTTSSDERGVRPPMARERLARRAGTKMAAPGPAPTTYTPADRENAGTTMSVAPPTMTMRGSTPCRSCGCDI